MQRFQSLCEIISIDKCLKMLLQSGLRVIVIPMHGRLLDGFIHSLDLTVCPRMRWLREPVLDSVFLANSIKNMWQSLVVPDLKFADSVALKKPMQRRAREARNLFFQSVQTVVKTSREGLRNATQAASSSRVSTVE